MYTFPIIHFVNRNIVGAEKITSSVIGVFSKCITVFPKPAGILNNVKFQGIVTRDTFWDRKVLKLVQEQLGGRVHTIACGAAPINPEVKVFL